MLRYVFTEKKYDLVFVIYAPNRGWILEAISREIAAYFPGKCHFYYSLENLPPAKAYFFAHYSLFPDALAKNPYLRIAKSLIWYTHPKEISVSNEALMAALNQATRVICTCSEFERLLISQGLNSQKVTYILGGADPILFQPHLRSTGAVGFCSAYYPRKSPDKILQIIKSMPHRQFLLIGRNWHEYEHFTELSQLPNLSYVEIAYAEYPKYYAQMDVFVSVAQLEGGPIPLIEAMMCNVVPVASRTGFAPDIIRPGENGFLFDVEAPVAEICQLIEQAFLIKTDVRATVENLSWKNFSLAVQSLLGKETL
ncbi:glycosyltransferase [Leptolyngbya boryana CZ1]|uniref:Glycosyltransferase n=1 Tax=Leptolyngbya boryana CZ1 TaxID=3060204 RepID=A0AA96X1T5_LEPBY|nr:glycosyltransferase [Leptolyngbya boryana]WNZ43985.1 glycosyltransferase [Leptolyngbya boryana CZ1]